MYVVFKCFMLHVFPTIWRVSGRRWSSLKLTFGWWTRACITPCTLQLAASAPRVITSSMIFLSTSLSKQPGATCSSLRVPSATTNPSAIHLWIRANWAMPGEYTDIKQAALVNKVGQVVIPIGESSHNFHKLDQLLCLQVCCRRMPCRRNFAYIPLFDIMSALQCGGSIRKDKDITLLSFSIRGLTSPLFYPGPSTFTCFHFSPLKKERDAQGGVPFGQQWLSGHIAREIKG